MFLLSKSADALRAAGLTVAPTDDAWLTRGHGDMKKVLGVLCHDTAGRSPPDDHSDFATVVAGRGGSDPIAGPLANWFLARSGVWWPVAAGKAYHAGYGELDGELGIFNAELIGVEAENVGVVGKDPWPDAQVDSYARGCAAFAKLYDFDAAHVLGHREYALPPGRKQDPDFDMVDFRSKVSAALAAQGGKT